MADDTKFLCTRCRRAMCTDCRQIADEYAELHVLRGRALWQAEQELEKLKRQLADAERRATAYEQVAKMGYPQVIQEWIAWKVKQ